MAEEIECYTAVAMGSKILDLRFEDFGGTCPAVDEGYYWGCGRSVVSVENLVGVEVEEWHRSRAMGGRCRMSRVIG